MGRAVFEKREVAGEERPPRQGQWRLNENLLYTPGRRLVPAAGVNYAGGWDANSLHRMLEQRLPHAQLLAVSNRQPCAHEHDGCGISLSQPASGLVTGLEPLMRACQGTWIAHGSGSADREVVDEQGRWKVESERGSYWLRRVWLTADEASGHCDGFANRGLWPLLHMAHTRPAYVESDWRNYCRVNAKFADAVLEEARVDDPIILIQDYHFALLPRMIRERLPHATIVTFWHVPWPHPDQWSICPWGNELLEGMLGSTIAGFQTPDHAANFLACVDRALEHECDPVNRQVRHDHQVTLVRDYPISIDWPTPQACRDWPSIEACRLETRRQHGLADDCKILLGIDRFDYTKGLIERLQAIEDTLEQFPGWIGRLALLQIASPTRTAVEEYTLYQAEVTSLAERINARFARGAWRPIHLIARHHDVEQVRALYRAADLCLVTSLQDGMNLVSKEFIAARDDEQGVLILSSFAGSAYELTDALIVNPYHTQEVGRAIDRALRMSNDEQRERMRALRRVVRTRNIYRWGAAMLLDAAKVSRPPQAAAQTPALRVGPLRHHAA